MCEKLEEGGLCGWGLMSRGGEMPGDGEVGPHQARQAVCTDTDSNLQELFLLHPHHLPLSLGIVLQQLTF